MKPCSLLLIDGNNLLHRSGAVRRAPDNFLDARNQLTEQLIQLQPRLPPTRLYYEGAGESRSLGNLEILFVGPGRSADGMIEAQLARTPKASSVCVVASDRSILEAAAARGAQTMGCANFLDWMRSEQQVTRQHTRRSQRRPRGNSLGNYFPPEAPGS